MNVNTLQYFDFADGSGVFSVAMYGCYRKSYDKHPIWRYATNMPLHFSQNDHMQK